MQTIILVSVLILALRVSLNDAGCFTRNTCDLRIDRNCYVHVDQSIDWYRAEACCVEWGGHLASIHRSGENHLLNYIRNKDRMTWIGLSDTVKNGQYVWTDGTRFDYNNFARGQPDSANGESCFNFNKNKGGELAWNDYHCSNSKEGSVRTSYLCQKKICPILEKTRCGLVQNGKCYIYVDKKTTWNEAEQCCKEWGGHLASIHSDLENYAVNSLRDIKKWAFIGLSDTAKDGTYVWTDGTPFDYNKFRRYEPSNGRNSFGQESCFHMFDKARGELTWNDFHCNVDHAGSRQTSYICKKDYDCKLCKMNQKDGRDSTYSTRGRRSVREVFEQNGNNTIEL